MPVARPPPQIAGVALEASAADIEFKLGRFEIVGTDRGIGILELAARLRSGMKLPEGVPTTLDVSHVHEAAPSAEYLPASQSVHDSAPEPEYVPASQSVHADALVLDHVPPSHLVHSLLPASENVPPEHWKHSAEAALA